mmetsp:Transcript_32558/g.98221  ORF Transcript_32558/g.98221 Transcript_32558/m.98221 type:complete len:877 (+) Transcript_32558:531-3161(+)
MMGTAEDSGIIPRLCRAIFDRAALGEPGNITHTVEVSYMEIYQERVRDLLAIKTAAAPLRVRENRATGPYVQNLNRLCVTGYNDIQVLMRRGNRLRKTARTAMNDTSSRSHAVFTLHLISRWHDDVVNHAGERASRVSLVDLAGSERVVKTGATGDRLKEGAQINKSLSTLGLVIKALADGGEARRGGAFVPYRDSVLTWLLKDSLGGNSKTVMVATVSPSVDNIDETVSTLRYANSAKQIVNEAVVNEDPKAAMIRDLREELERLRAEVGRPLADKCAGELRRMQDQITETERLLRVKSATWEERLKQSQLVMDEHRQLLAASAARVAFDNGALRLESDLPHLVVLQGAVTLHALKPGIVRIGQDRQEPLQDIPLSSELGVEPEHCLIEHTPGAAEDSVPTIEIHPVADECFVNDRCVNDSVILHHGDKVRLGPHWTATFFNPTEALHIKRTGGCHTPLIARRCAGAQRNETELEKLKEAADRERECMRAEISAQVAAADRAAKLKKEEAERVRNAMESQELERRRLRQTTDEQATLQSKLREIKEAINVERARKAALAAGAPVPFALTVRAGPPDDEVGSDVDLDKLAADRQLHELAMGQMAARRKAKAKEAELWRHAMEKELAHLQRQRELARREKEAMEARRRAAQDDLAQVQKCATEAKAGALRTYEDLAATLSSSRQHPRSATVPIAGPAIAVRRVAGGPADDFGLGSTASFVAVQRARMADVQEGMHGRKAGGGDVAKSSLCSTTPSPSIRVREQYMPRAISPEVTSPIRADDFGPLSPTSTAEWEAELQRLQLDEQITNDEILARKLQWQDEVAMQRAQQIREQRSQADARLATSLAHDIERERARQVRHLLDQDAELARQIALADHQ